MPELEGLVIRVLAAPDTMVLVAPNIKALADLSTTVSVALLMMV